MAVVRKTLLVPGDYVSPDGNVKATPERIAGWVDSFRRLSDGGVKIPVPFGHQLKARPAEAADADMQAYLQSKFNAGYVQELLVGPDGALEGVFDLPALQVDAGGNLIDPQLGTAISEVSIAPGAWKDGQGTVWPDVINHVALAPLPVWADQDGFQQLSTNADQPPMQRLSLSHLATDAYDEVSDHIGRTSADDGDEDLDEDDDGTPDLLEPALTPSPDLPDMEVESVKGLLGEMGVPLPGETGRDNILEHLMVALTVLRGRIQMEKQAEQAVDAVTPSPPAAAVPAAAPGRPPMMLSTNMTEREKKLVDKLIAGRKAELVAEIGGLEKAGLPKSGADELRARIGTTRMSLTADAEVQVGSTAWMIEFLKKHMPKSTTALTTKLATATRLPNPAKDVTGEKVDYKGIPMTKDQAAFVERVTGGGVKANGKK